MAVTITRANDPQAVKLWSRVLGAEALKATDIAPLIGTKTDNIIQLRDETAKSAGDRVTFSLRSQLRGVGVTEGQTLEGNEESMRIMSQSVVINELRHAVRVKTQGSIDAQRVSWNDREEAIKALADWYGARISTMAFAQFCGYTGKTLSTGGGTYQYVPQIFGFNNPQAPSANRHIIMNKKANEAALTADDNFTLSAIDEAVTLAQLANPMIRPVRINSDNVFVMYLYPTQVKSLRTNTSTGQWLDIQKAAYNGSRANNPIFDGSLGMYNGVVLRMSQSITNGLDPDNNTLPNVRRAVLLGAQAGVIAYGQVDNKRKYRLIEEFFDYQNELGVSAATILGFAKTRYKAQDSTSTEDFATIVVSSYDA